MTSARNSKPIIDCDIHNTIVSPSLNRYLSHRWRRHAEIFGQRTQGGSTYPRAAPHAARDDAWPPSGLPPGGDLGFMRKQLLDPLNIEYGVLNCLSGGPNQLNPDFAAALCSAVNDCQITDWFDEEPRLRGGVVVPQEHADLAVAEIDRVGDHPGFVQVLLVLRTAEPLGRRKYWPLYQAAVRHDLPVAIHVNGPARMPITASGWPSYFIEDHTGLSQTAQAQVASLCCEGVFERFPSLRVVLIEGGFAWLPSLMWRLDKHWRRLREEVPHLTRLPSEYIRHHLWVTTQPMEEPHRPPDLLTVFEHLGGVDRVMFSTDYPHWDFDNPGRAFPTALPTQWRDAIYANNARALYGLN